MTPSLMSMAVAFLLVTIPGVALTDRKTVKADPEGSSFLAGMLTSGIILTLCLLFEWWMT